MRLESAILATLFCVASTPALAADSNRNLDLEVQGRVLERCSLGVPGEMDFGDLNRTGITGTAVIQFDCNMPFTIEFKARSGGLAHEALPNGQGPYAGLVPYRMSVAVPVRHPSASLLAASFTSRELMGGSLISSGGGIATEGMTLSVALEPTSSEAGLLAGQYGEVVTVTVAPS